LIVFERFIYYFEDESEDEGRAVQARKMGRAVGMRRERAWTDC
jgi:hypothetical protein